MNTKDGGYAFPRQLKQVENSMEFERSELAAQTGMTLRDYFAGQVLASVAAELIKAMSTSEKTWIGEAADELDTDSDTYIADCCYDMADKMIEARELEQ